MKSKPFILIIGLAILFVGIIFAIPEVVNLKHMNDITTVYPHELYTYFYKMEDDKVISFDDVKVIYDDTIEEGILIETAYFKDFINDIQVKIKENNHNTKIEIIPEYSISIDDITTVHKNIANDLKAKYIYDYQYLIIPQTTIRLNQKYKDLIIVK